MKNVLRSVFGVLALWSFFLFKSNSTDIKCDEILPSNGCIKNFGKIVFSYYPRDTQTVHYGIYLMNPDGSGRVRLSSPDAKTDTMPSWSPDRCWIAFVRFSKEGRDDIYVMSADGKTIRRLTKDPGQDTFPDWSPDGKKISFISDRDGFRNLFVMNEDGSNQKQLTNQQNLPKSKGGYVQWQQWSPKGDEIAFTYNPGKGKGPCIYVVKADGSGLRQITQRGMEPIWSLDGNKIYFLDSVPLNPGIEIWEVNRDGSGLRQITHFGGSVIPDHSLRLSPDGKLLAFYGTGPEVTENGTEIYVVNIDGSGLRNISRSRGQDEWIDW